MVKYIIPNDMNLLDIQIGERLKDARNKSKFTLLEVSKKLNISKQSLLNYESGKGNPSLHNIIDLCRLYKISPNYLINGEDDNLKNINNSLKRKIYNLASIDLDGDISYNSYLGTITFNNKELKKYFAYCHVMFTSSKEFSKLEIVDNILKFLDTEINDW